MSKQGIQGHQDLIDALLYYDEVMRIKEKSTPFDVEKALNESSPRPSGGLTHKASPEEVAARLIRCISDEN